jgi:hypothetical protein
MFQMQTRKDGRFTYSLIQTVQLTDDNCWSDGKINKRKQTF